VNQIARTSSEIQNLQASIELMHEAAERVEALAAPRLAAGNVVAYLGRLSSPQIVWLLEQAFPEGGDRRFALICTQLERSRARRDGRPARR
jgi:hypothetical protein